MDIVVTKTGDCSLDVIIPHVANGRATGLFRKDEEEGVWSNVSRILFGPVDQAFDLMVMLVVLPDRIAVVHLDEMRVEAEGAVMIGPGDLRVHLPDLA